jgi:hypothetical protein
MHCREVEALALHQERQSVLTGGRFRVTRIRVELGPPAHHGDGGTWPADRIVLSFAGGGELLKAELVSGNQVVRELPPSGFNRLVSEEGEATVHIRSGTGTPEGPIDADAVTCTFKTESTAPVSTGPLPTFHLYCHVEIFKDGESIWNRKIEKTSP